MPIRNEVRLGDSSSSANARYRRAFGLMPRVGMPTGKRSGTRVKPDDQSLNALSELLRNSILLHE